MAFVRRKPNSPYWQAVYNDESGKRCERSTKETDFRKARKVAEEWEWAAKQARKGELTQARILKTFGEILERTTGESLEVQNPVRDFFKQWLAEKETGRASSTVTRYRPILNGFQAFLGKHRSRLSLSGITTTDIVRFRDQQIRDGKSPSTADYTVKVLRAVFETARRRSIILNNPTLAVEMLGGAREERIPFTDEQVKKLLNEADSEWQGMILFGYYTGIRLHDAANLTWSNVDMEKRTLSFRESKTATRRRENKATVVYLHPAVIKWLKSRQQGIENAPLFPSLYGKESGSAGGLSTAFTRLMERAKVISPLGEEKKGKGRQFRKLTFHSLRHTFISRLANAEVSADVRRAMSGHSSEEIHQRYVHLDLSSQKEALEKLPSISTIA